ncbi:PAS domain-containing protein [Neobacillus pocheonensis]|uniref:PAS domain-containing protein n=1 Tax=Neobacillus pocheonensis TaxID=363869 RepID=UPI003D26F2D4
MVENGPSVFTWKFMTRIFQHYKEGFIIIDPEGAVLVFNTTARKILKVDYAVNTIKDFPGDEIQFSPAKENNVLHLLGMKVGGTIRDS